MALVNIYTHSFYDDLLGARPSVLDLGANVGNWATRMVERYACRCLAIEPSPEAFAQIPVTAAISKRNLAVAGETGTLMLNLSSNSEANSLGKATGFDYVGQVAVEAVTLCDALALAGDDRIALLKLDIEGAEIEVLGGSDPAVLRRCDQITVEFHDFCDLTPRDVVRATVHKVRDAGFHVFYFDRNRYRYADVLFVNRARMDTLRYWREMGRLWAPRTFAAITRRLTGRG